MFAVPITPPAWRRCLLAVGLGVVGLALNSLPTEIFSGIHLLHGHPPVIAAAVLLGPAAGAVAGAIAAAITPVFFGHPWAVVLFTLEGLVLGRWCRRHLPASSAAVFWLLAAVPYGLLLRLEYPTGTVVGIAVKTVAEATLGALVIQVALLAPRIHRWARPLLPPPLRDVRTRTTVRSVVLLAALFPLVALGVTDARQVYERRLEEVDRANLASADRAAQAIASLIDRTRAEVAESAAAPGDQLALLLLREPLVREAALVEGGRVRRSAGRAAGTWFVVGAALHLPPGADVAELDPSASGRPLLAVSSPDVNGGELVAILDPEVLDRVLAARTRSTARLFLLGATGRVLGKTDAVDPDERLRRGIVAAGAHGTSSFLAEPNPPRSLRPQATERVAVSTVEPFDLRVVFVLAQAALQPQIEAAALQGFGGFLAAVLAAVGAGLILVRVIVRPVDEVARATRRLIRGERGARVDGLVCEAPRELRLLAAEFNRMAGELERQLAAVDRATRARDEFLSVASHELKTPLAILKAQIGLIERRPDEPHDRQLRTIARQLDRLNRLITQLLDASAQGPEALPLDRKELELSEVVRRVAEDFRAIATGRELRLDLDEARGRWDELRLEQVLHNLIGNALKYGPAGKPIEVTLRARPGGGAILRVADRGIGIRPDDLKRLFQRFSRGTAATGEGLGVGLYVVRKIVERHGGTVSLTPREGGGTVATVELPADAAPGSANASSRREDPA